MAQASEVLSPGRELHWFGWKSLAERAKKESLTVMILSSIFEMDFRSTIMRKEAGVS